VTRLKGATRATFRSLRYPNFRIFFVTQGISFIGTWLQLAAQILLVYRLTDSGTALGILTAIQFAPTLLLGAWAGVVVDRHDKRRLIRATSTVMGLTAATLAVLVLTGNETVGIVYALAAVLGLANTFDNPARRTLVNDLVPPGELVNAVSLNSTLVTVARIVGPAVAGALIATVGIGWCFALNALSFVPVVVGLARMDDESFASRPVPRAKGQLRAGLRYAMSVDELRVPLLLMAVVGTLSFNFAVVLPLLAERDLGGSDVTYTVLTSFFGVGSLLGSLRMARRETVDTTFLGRSAIALGLSSAVLAGAPTIPAAAAILLVAGWAGIGVLSGGNAVLQLATSAEMRGRVLALYTVVFLGSTPIGGPIAGLVAQRAGTPAAILLGAVASVAAGAGVLVFVRRRAGAPAGATAPDPVVLEAVEAA
jgi:MFS family permease